MPPTAMGSSIIQSRSWHEDSGSNEPEQQDATLASSGVKIPVNVKMSASMGSSIIQSRSWHEDSGSNEPEQLPTRSDSNLAAYWARETV